MNLQIATQHALLAILELAATSEHQVAAADIAAKYGLSPNHLAKVLRTLGRAGLVEASRGVGGGYRFCGNAKRLTLFDIITTFEPVTTRNHAVSDATQEGLALREVLTEVEENTRATLSSITVETMLKSARRQVPRADMARPRKTD